jgi:spore germination protein KB
MVNEEKIGHREAVTLLTLMITAKIFLSFPRNMALLGESAGWIITLLAGIIAGVGYYFLHRLLAAYPDLNLIEIARRVTGKYLGVCFGLISFLFFLVICSLYLRQFAESFILAVLPRTPISVITMGFLFLLAYGVILGIETISRVAWFFGPYLLVTLLIILLSALPRATLEHLVPILGRGPLIILKEAPVQLSSFAELLLLGIIAPLIRNKQKVFRVGFYSLLMAVVINMGVVGLVSAVFNYNAAANLVFPILQLTRLISLGEFIQRVEAVFVFLWFFWAGIQLSGLFYGTVVSFAQTFRIKNYRPLVPALALLVFTVSLIPTSMTQAVEISDSAARLSWIGDAYGFTAFGIPLILLFIHQVKKWIGDGHDA